MSERTTHRRTGLRRIVPALLALAGVLAVAVLLATCRTADGPSGGGWVDALRDVDVAAARNARGRVVAPGFDHWEQRDEDVSVALVPDALATLGATPPAGPLRADDLAGLQPLRRNGVAVSAVTAGDRDAAYAAAVARHGAGNVGYAVLFPVPDAEPESWPGAVLTPDIVLQLAADFVAQAGDLRTRTSAALAPLGLTLVDLDPDVPEAVVVRAAGADPAVWLDASRRLRLQPFCGGTAHPDLILPVVPHQEQVPGWPPAGGPDPLAAEQWHLGGADGGPEGARVRAAWDVLQRRGERPPIVAVLDPDGVEWAHPERLHATVSVPPFATGRDWLRFGWDYRAPHEQALSDADLRPWHGTAAAGLIVARRENGAGGAGVAPFAGLLPVRIGNRASATARAIYFAAGRSWPGEHGADVLSLSFGYGAHVHTPAAVREAVEWARDAGRGGLGCVIVASLSNERLDNFAGWDGALCAIPGVLAVGRVTDADLWGQSGYGGGMALLAPSGPSASTATKESDPSRLLGTQSITTTDVTGVDGRNTGTGSAPYDNPQIRDLTEDLDHTRVFSGTSAAVPIVAGTAALVLAADPGMSGSDVRFVLRTTARRVDPDGARADGTSAGPLDTAEYARTRGHGCVDAAAAVARALQGPPYGYDDPPIVRRFPGPLAIAPGLVAVDPRLHPTSPGPSPAPAPPGERPFMDQVQLTVTAVPDLVPVDGIVTCRVTVGGADGRTAEGVVVRVTAPREMRIEGASGPPDLVAAGALDHTVRGRVVTFAPAPRVGESDALVFEVRLRATSEATTSIATEVSQQGRVGTNRTVTPVLVATMY